MDSALFMPPELLEPAEPEYPEAARARRLEASALLQLRIDSAGTVTEAIVLEAAGPGFDEAAQAAARRLVFAPARYRGRPTIGMVRYRFSFQPPPPPATGGLVGRVTLEPGAPVAALEALITGPDGVARSVAVDGAGQFRVPELVAGRYTVRVVDADREATGTVDVVAGRDVEFALAWGPIIPAPHPTSETVVTGGDVTVVTGEFSSPAQLLEQSAEAVHVVDTRQAKVQAADLGAVLARTQGVSVRREGALGSSARFMLNGLTDDQVRFFLDGVPLDQSGFPFGIANVPVNLIDRVEVYRGVVPIRFGADALGGAVNLVSPERRDSYLGGSYQVGSFGTHRATLDGRYRHEPSGFVLGQTAFVDSAKNDYEVDVLVPLLNGQLVPRKVPRLHDAYRAYGGTLSAGVIDRPWARRLLLTGFAATYDKQLQHDLTMTRIYGEAEYGETVYGATARYDVAPSSKVDLQLTANYSRRVIDFHDESRWTYDWPRRRTGTRDPPGETPGGPSNSTLWQDAAFGRALLTWELAPGEHILRASVSPAFTKRTGRERLRQWTGPHDPLSAKRALLTLVTGLEYETNLFDERLSNVVFAKDYVYHAETEEYPESGGELQKRTANSHSQGVGDALRYRVTPWLYAKASYEYAMRMPRPDELFGNGGLIRANLKLKPEVSHNANLGPRLELEDTPIGNLTVDINAFLRLSDRLIVLLTTDDVASYQNVYKARALGLENALAWTSPGRWLSVDGMLTWQDVRNASSKGAFGEDLKGDRIPNRPYLLGSWGARLRFPGMPKPQDTIEPFYYGRYVHSFFRGWESLGVPWYKDTIDTQLTHDLGVSWLVSREVAHMTATFEVQNLNDARLYDNFGVQRPGRAFFLKLTATFP